MKASQMIRARVLIRDGKTERTVLVIGASGTLLLARWDGGAPCEFSLTSGVIQATPQSAWKWRLHPDDLTTLRAEFKTPGELKPPPMKRQRPSREAQAHSAGTQRPLFGGHHE